MVLLLALTFAAGAAAGVAADRLDVLPAFARSEERESDRSDDGRDDRDGREERQTTIERFADELELSSEQRSEIDGILDHYRTSMRGLWHEYRPRYRSLVDSVRTRIEIVLTPEQVTQYRALLERRRHGRDGDEEGRRPDDGGDRDRSDTTKDGATRSDDDGRR
ncbi:MAG: hypothetical protein ACRELC_14245 [Gemmatimonadota bacterium]